MIHKYIQIKHEFKVNMYQNIFGFIQVLALSGMYAFSSVADPFHFDMDPAPNPTKNRENINFFLKRIFLSKIYFSKK